MKQLVALAAIVSLLATACVTDSGAIPGGVDDVVGNERASTTVAPTDPTETSDPTRIDLSEVPAGQLVGLQRVDTCDGLLEYFKTEALAQVGPWGLGDEGGWAVDTVDDLGGANESTSGSQDGGRSEPSSTNVQVDGVDEGDIVKAVGDILYVIHDTGLRVFSTADEGLEELATLDLGSSAWNSQMLVSGNHLVLMGAGSSSHAVNDIAGDSIWAPSVGFATVALIDVSDPSAPSLDKRLTIDGSVVTTRMVDDHLRVILQSRPVGLAWSHPEGSGLRSERDATERNRQVIEDSTIDNWLPYVLSNDATVDEGLLDCADVYLPPEPSGLGVLSILDFDLSAGVDTWESASVVAEGSTVYANLDSTYVSTSRWFNPAVIDSRRAFDGHTTRIHRFDTPVDGTLTYVASGDVPGFLLNQFAMDEYEGNLRVATTESPGWWGGGGESESRVTVLAPEDDELVTLGTVTGLGLTETIRAVRFMGDTGYVVTFRQTDPLYVIDLSDPAAPRAVGELKIPGFSSYLHPVADGRLLGVGQDADPETGQVKGLQLSLFDVSDPANPQRLDTFGIAADEGAESHIYSAVEGDHRAFTSVDGAAYLPYEGWAWNETTETDTAWAGIIEVNWEDDSLAGSRDLSIFRGKPTESTWWFNPQRVVIKGETAYVVGYGGITMIELPDGNVSNQVRF